MNIYDWTYNLALIKRQGDAKTEYGAARTGPLAGTALALLIVFGCMVLVSAVDPGGWNFWAALHSQSWQLLRAG